MTAAIFDDTLYVVYGCNELMGGSFCSNYPSALLAAPLYGDGGVGPFASLVSHPNASRGAQLGLMAGRLVAVAGYDGNPQGWSFVSELHGRGRLGPARPAQVLPSGTTAQIASGEAVYAATGAPAKSSGSACPAVSSGFGSRSTATRASRAVRSQLGYDAALSEEYDCTACGACCYGRRDYVQVFPDDAARLGEARLAELVAPPVGEHPASVGRPAEPRRFMKMKQGRCTALRTPSDHVFHCAVYEDRPFLCRAFEPGSGSCLDARARRALLTGAPTGVS